MPVAPSLIQPFLLGINIIAVQPPLGFGKFKIVSRGGESDGAGTNYLLVSLKVFLCIRDTFFLLGQ